MDVCIRPEEGRDQAAVSAILEAAFAADPSAEGPPEDDAEVRLVEMLRLEADPVIALVAEEATSGEVVGHIVFSPVTARELPGRSLMGLGPMAVSPQHQRSGIGSMLVQSGLELCRKLETDGVVVLGHPQYYPRFGFEPSTRFNIRSEYDVPEDVFMVLELRPGALDSALGSRDPAVVRYHPAFSRV